MVGARNSGKTSFIEFLRTSLVLPPRKQRPHARESDGPLQPQTSRINSNFVSHYLETEAEDGERIGLTIWDSEGLDANIVDLQLRELASFVESKFEETFNEENKVVRSPGVRDTHIHCVFLVLDPLRLDANINATRKARENNAKLANGSANVYASAIGDLSGLDNNLDLQVLRALQGKTTVVPVISKADTITTEHMAELKREIWGALKKANLDPLEPLGLEGDDDDDEEAISSDEDGVVKNRPRHNSKRFDERDEDDFSNTSHLESPSSSSSTSTVEKKPTAGSSDDSFPLPPGSSAGPHVPVTQTAPGAPILPLSIISPEPIVTHEPGPGRVARKFPWGSADPYNPEHCDFVRLKEAVFLEWRGDLREASREIWYEGWRTSRLNLRQTTATASVAAGRRQGQQQHAHQNLPVRSMMPDNGVGIAR